MEAVLDSLRKKLTGFEEREGQVGMLRDVTRAYEENKIALIEAETGTGKSIAYLIPALLWALEKGETTVVATHTISLQEQLLQKDIPFLLEALNLNLRVVLVKGMHNYICLRKLQDAAFEGVPSTLLSWVHKTKEGSKSALPLPIAPDLWEQIAAEGESCTGQKCPYYKECFFFKARKEAQEAHLIIANHHLLFADLAVREEIDNYKDPCVLPPYGRVVIDEAHHIEDVATEYFAKKVSRKGLIHQLGRLFSDRSTGKFSALLQRIKEGYPDNQPGEALRVILNDLELSLPMEKKHLGEVVHHLFEALGEFLAIYPVEEKLRVQKEQLAHPFWIATVQPLVSEVTAGGRNFLQACLLVDQQVKNLNDPSLYTKCEGILADIKGICSRLNTYFDLLLEFAHSPLQESTVRWIEGESPHLQLMIAELDIAPRLTSSLFSRFSTVVLCSATLSTHKKFDFIRSRLGIPPSLESIYSSPFNFANQALLAVPIDLPDPSMSRFVQEAARSIFEVTEISGGGVFALFTSYTMLKECATLLNARFLEKGYALFCQGEEGRSQLLGRFKETKKAVLFGTDSFWEGVDVVGEALRCVILVKLPFKVPSDPLFQARSELIAEKGGSPFFDYSLPHAIVKFKQGFGRLIRTKADKGCVVCLDPRLVKKGYGKLFLKSLPTCPNHFDTLSNLTPLLKEFYSSPRQ